tara:strand:+ start:303 stop:740 length:438 start_codon:yes stop_codon:yes gene_type:complete
MILGYNKLLSIFLGCIAVLFIGCNKDLKTQETSAVEKIPAVAENFDPDCVEYVALWAAGDIAERIGKDKKWVFLNYTVDLWDTPPAEGEGNTVGKLRASSYARIIEKREDDYMVESPINQVQGWISNEHVKTTSWKNPKTRKLCK